MYSSIYSMYETKLLNLQYQRSPYIDIKQVLNLQYDSSTVYIDIKQVLNLQYEGSTVYRYQASTKPSI